MSNWSQRPICLARTRQGNIVLHVEGAYWYAFRFGKLERRLTADEFKRLHYSALRFDPSRLPAPAPYTTGERGALGTVCASLFGQLSQADMIELKELLGRAALMITSLSRAWNELN